MLSLMLFSTLAYAADCPSATTAQQVQSSLDAALRSYGELDEEGFLAAADRAQAEVTCLGGVIPREGAAALHRVTGLRWFVQGDPDQATASFSAALALDPIGLPADIAPAGGKLYKFFEEAREAPEAIGNTFPYPRGMVAWVDGTRGNERSDGLPAIVQIDDGQGRVVWSSYVAANDDFEIPAEVGVSEESEDLSGLEELDEPTERGKAEKEPKEKGEKGQMNTKPLWIGAGVSGGVAAAMYGGSALSRMQFDKDPSKGGFYMTNGAYYGSIGVGVVALGLSSVAIGGSF